MESVPKNPSMSPTLTPSTEEARIYECIVLLSMQLSEKEYTQAIAAIEQLFEEKGGKRLKKDVWGKQGLAYPIEKQSEGQYIVYLYELPPESAQAIDAALLLEKPVLRHLLVKIPKQYEFVTFAERKAAWEKEKENEVQEKEKEREETLKQKMIHRAAVSAPPKEEKKRVAPEAEGSLDEKLGEIISDEDLRL